MMNLNLITTLKGSLLEKFFPIGWDIEKIEKCCSNLPSTILERQTFWHPEFNLMPCDNLEEFNAKMGYEIASEIRETKEKGQTLVLILPVGPVGMYKWVVYFLRKWNIDAKHVYGFSMDEWSDKDGNTLPPYNKASFQYVVENALYGPLGELTVPETQRHFATKQLLPLYEEKINNLKIKSARVVLVFGIGRVFHIAFWEPHFAAEFPTEEEWRVQTHRLGAPLHPLTIEQNALTSFKGRFTLVPCFANTIGPGIFLKVDKAIGGCDGIFGRDMQWQGVSLWVTLRYGPNIWVPSSFMPTLPGRLFFIKQLAGPLEVECN